MTNQKNQQPPNDQYTVIGADTTIKGEMFFEKSACILGQFEGKIGANGEVQIGASALCKAAIEAERIIVDGAVAGPIHARDCLTLTANARVQGDLTAGTLVVAEGASFVGQCNVGPNAGELADGSIPARQTNAQHTPLAETKPAGEPVAAGSEFSPPWNQNNNAA